MICANCISDLYFWNGWFENWLSSCAQAIAWRAARAIIALMSGQRRENDRPLRVSRRRGGERPSAAMVDDLAGIRLYVAIYRARESVKLQDRTCAPT